MPEGKKGHDGTVRLHILNRGKGRATKQADIKIHGGSIRVALAPGAGPIEAGPEVIIEPLARGWAVHIHRAGDHERQATVRVLDNGSLDMTREV